MLADINAADESAVCMPCQDIVQTSWFLAAVSALERVQNATFEGTQKSVQKSELGVFCETQQ